MLVPACAVVTVEKLHAPHKAVLIVDSSKCEPLPDGAYYDYNGGYTITFGVDGECIHLTRSDEKVLVLVVDYKRGLARHLTLSHYAGESDAVKLAKSQGIW